MPRTLKQLAQEALDVQDACNLSGVALSFGRAVKELREIMPDVGTNTINHHPIVQLWVDKLADLSGMYHLQEYATFTNALAEVRRLAQEEPK